jgi:hypothetical protein
MIVASFKGLNEPWQTSRHANRIGKLDPSNVATRRGFGGSLKPFGMSKFDRHPDPLVRDFIYSRLSDVDNVETVYGLAPDGLDRSSSPYIGACTRTNPLEHQTSDERTELRQIADDG